MSSDSNQTTNNRFLSGSNELIQSIRESSRSRCIADEDLSQTGFNYTLSIIGGKYKVTVLYTLMEFGVVRFNEMKRYIGGISYKTLSATLKELQEDGLVHREEYPQIPPKVEYSLTTKGESLIPFLDGLCEWGDLNRPRSV